MYLGIYILDIRYSVSTAIWIQVVYTVNMVETRHFRRHVSLGAGTMSGYNAYLHLVSYYNNSINYRIVNRVMRTIAFIGRLIFKQITKIKDQTPLLPKPI